MNIGYKTTIDKASTNEYSTSSFTVLEDKSNTCDKYVVWHIEGGLGKNIAATALVSPLKKKYNDRKLILVVSYPEVFLNHPDIHRVYRIGMTSFFYDDYIKDKDTIIFRQEPYFQSDHIMRKKHLIQNWCDILNIEYEDYLPILYQNMIQKNLMYNWQRDKPIMLIQANGGPMNSETLYSWTRDIPYIITQSIVDRYSKDYHIIQIGKDIKQAIQGVEFVSNSMSNSELFSLLPLSRKRVLIDSCLQHASAAMNLKSTVLWIGTSANNFGYKMHHNIEAKKPIGNVKMIDSYLFDYSFDGIIHECPYNDYTEMFDISDIFSSIDTQ